MILFDEWYKINYFLTNVIKCSFKWKMTSTNIFRAKYHRQYMLRETFSRKNHETNVYVHVQFMLSQNQHKQSVGCFE